MVPHAERTNRETTAVQLTPTCLVKRSTRTLLHYLQAPSSCALHS
jgi:hypothetical protein